MSVGKEILTVGFDKNGEADFGVAMSVCELTFAQMKELRAMLPVAIGVLENTWRDAQMRKPESWAEAARGDLDSFAGLPNNWDSYGGVAVDKSAIAKARELLAVLPDGPWQAVPGAGGDVQLELHTKEFDIEISIEASNGKLNRTRQERAD